MSDASVRALNEFGADRFPGLVGLEITEQGPARVTGHITITRALIAGTGYVWAPVVIGLADILCAYGVPEHLPEGFTSFTTVELKVNFLASAKLGEVLVGEARIVHTGRMTQVWDATVINQSTERTVALFRCTQMLLASAR